MNSPDRIERKRHYWWNRFPPGAKIGVLVRCRYESEEPPLRRAENRDKKMKESLKIIGALRHYIQSHPELYPQASQTAISELVATTSLGLFLTPTECDNLITCPLVMDIIEADDPLDVHFVEDGNIDL